MSKTYRVTRTADGVEAVIMHPDHRCEMLPPRNDVFNHSPDGFEFGYAGSGPAQLALAVCIDALGGNEDITGPCPVAADDIACAVDYPAMCKCGTNGPHNTHRCRHAECGATWERAEVSRARRVYQDFKWEHIAKAKDMSWEMTAAEVLIEIRKLEARRSRRTA